MNDKNTGGSAFPVIAENGLGHISDGMTLRDWFAGRALEGMCQYEIRNGYPLEGNSEIETMARTAYFYADAMLKEREK